jgi:hypothetical protein
MSLTSWADSKLKKLSWVDMAFTKVSCFAFGILLARLIPGLIEINILWIVAVWILLAIKPLYSFFKKNNG